MAQLHKKFCTKCRMETIHLNNECNACKASKWNPEDANASETGSLRYNKGKPEIHQVPPQLTQGAAEGFGYGQSKYGKWNWAKGNYYSVPYDSLRRHLDAFFFEGDFDKESGIHHLKLAATNLAMLLYYVENYPEMDDRPIKNEAANKTWTFPGAEDEEE